MGAQKLRIYRITEETYDWKRISIELGRYRSDFSVTIEGNRNSKRSGYMVIDDISFSSKHLNIEMK